MLDGVLHWAYQRVDVLGHSPEMLEAIRLFLIHAYVPVMVALLSLTTACALLARGALAERLRAIPPAAWIAALVLFNFALALRLWWAPHMPQVYLDEISFLNTADNMARNGLNQLSTVDGPNGDLFHQCPQAWQFLISLAYRALDVHVGVAFCLASLLSAASVMLIFLVLFESSGRLSVGLWGALFLAVLPVHLRLSGCSALETPSLFFLLLTLHAMHVWRATRSCSALLLVGCLAAWFANVRMENSFALGPLLLLYFLLLVPSGALQARPQRVALAASLAVAGLFTLPALLADFYGIATHFYFFYQAPAVTHAQILSNLHGNLPYWIDDHFHPLLFTLLAAVGVAAALVTRTQRRMTAFWLLWTTGLIAFYTMNPSCDFALRHTLDSWRTALHPGLGVIMLAALGADALMRVFGGIAARLMVAGLVLFSAALPWLFTDFVQMRHLWMMQWEAICSMRASLPPDSHLLVLDHSSMLSPASPGLAYELAAACGVAPHYFILPDEPAGRADDGNETLLAFLDSIVAPKVENRRPFLYHLDAGTVQDSRDLARMQSLLQLQPVAGTSMRKIHACFSLWRIDGIGAGRAGPRP